MAFVPPSESSWRFSYVKMEYATTEKKSDKVGVETRLTPARRFSYIVGEGESCHTAQTRFLNLLRYTEANPTLADIEHAFSVEPVTDEFFKKYVALFEDVHKALQQLVTRDTTIRREFNTKGVKTVDFAKKLMGQVVFLYFLQRKGWLGVEKGRDWGTGPRDFLRHLASGQYGRCDNFFNDVLEPLLYDTLATDRGDEAWCDRFSCRIPFLNGGLFEPLADYDWRKIDILLPNRLFTNSELFNEGVPGTGILDVFDRYNFTVNEAEPLEKEVAIDPEMLGKVFENLIEENRRKGLGSYYTPREIVHYMCQESLIDYLDTALNREKETVSRADLETLVHLGEQISHYEAVATRYPIKMPKSIEQNARLIDEKLADITVCDPAVGSGAFPVGMMTEIVRARCALTPYFNDVHRTPYHFKRDAIQNCLYGVDIDPGAVEIAKLRLWLSLVVDEEDVKQIKSLPNLFYKIVTANSLLGVENTVFSEKLFRRLEELKPRYFDEPDKEKKDRYKQEIENTIRELTTGKEAFDFEIYFSEVFHRKDGFDVLIANPPYVRHEQIKEFKPLFKDTFECFTGIADLYVYFIERSVKLLRNGGVLAFITSNKYLRSGYGEKLRDYIAKSTCIKRLIDFGELPVFAAGTDPAVLILIRETPAENYQFLAAVMKNASDIDRIAQAVSNQSNALPQGSLKREGWTLENSTVLSLLAKLRCTGKKLGAAVNGRFYYGIKTGFNEAFVVDRATRDRLIRGHKSSAEILKPFLNGRDVKRWRAEFSEQYLIKIESSENKDHPWSGESEREAEKIFATSYPAIHAHFEKFRSSLKKRDDQGRYFWELRSCIYWQEFEQPKIIYNETSKELHAFFDESGFYANKTLFILVAPAAKFLLGILLSRTLDWLFRHEFPSWGDPWNGGRIQFRGDRMETVPIPAAPPEKQKAVERLVDRILAAKQRDAEADVSGLERELDQLVYALYGLTREEIEIVEGAAK